jgi:membrane protein YdbS with pleckstrin-like domain
MPYPRDLLNEHEEIVVEDHPHWLYFLQPILAALATVAVLVFLSIVTNDVPDILTTLGLLVLVGIGLWALYRLVNWRSIDFVITSDRVIYRSGVFAKRGIEIPLNRVNNVNFSQGILERMVGAGNLMIESGGETGQSHFTDIHDPQNVQRAIHQQIDRHRHRPAAGYVESTPMPPPPPAPAPAAAPAASSLGVADELEKLESLLQRGTITQAQFEDQKRKLLGG